VVHPVSHGFRRRGAFAFGNATSRASSDSMTPLITCLDGLRREPRSYSLALSETAFSTGTGEVVKNFHPRPLHTLRVSRNAPSRGGMREGESND
jgi:hypothetical protein